MCVLGLLSCYIEKNLLRLNLTIAALSLVGVCAFTRARPRLVVSDSHCTCQYFGTFLPPNGAA